MSRFVILKNRKLMGVYDRAQEARRAILKDLDKNPRSTYEVAKLIRRIKAERTPPRFSPVEEDLDQ